MGILGIAGGALLGGGLLGSLTAKKPKYDMSAMNEAYRLISEQYGQIDEYFSQANQAFEEQFQSYYGQEMQDAVNAIAGSGIFESPVSQNILTRKEIALGETYAGAKSKLAGEKLSAIGQIDQQKIAYYQNLANLQYAREQQKAQSKNQLFGTIAGLGAALI